MKFRCVPQNGSAAASLSVAEQYVSAFSHLAKESNTILLPSNTGDISGMVTQVSPPQAGRGDVGFCAVGDNGGLLHSGYEHLQHAGEAQSRSSSGGDDGGERRGSGQSDASLTETTNELGATGDVCLLLRLGRG